jgi:hypothetical protein
MVRLHGFLFDPLGNQGPHPRPPRDATRLHPVTVEQIVSSVGSAVARRGQTLRNIYRWRPAGADKLRQVRPHAGKRIRAVRRALAPVRRR